MEPLTGTDPIPLSIEAEVALVELQLSVEVSSGWIVSGEALNITVGNGGNTVTVALAETVPPEPFTVIV